MRVIRLPLTKQQKDAFDFILESIDKSGYPPNIPEIQKRLNLNNPGHVYNILNALEKKRYIKRKKGMHRSITLTRISESMVVESNLKHE
jgi:SOS-response transcriptional repressor LexA